MAFWVTHLYVADVLMEKFATLERQAFCAGNIAPDCNVENEDWTAFTPPREITHFMSGKDKDFDGCERFYSEHIKGKSFLSNAEKSFLFGYYAHLVTDVVYQNHVRDDARVKNVWRRIMSDPDLQERAEGLPHTWANAKMLIPKEVRLLEQQSLEAEYLAGHPESGYLTEILPMKECETYLDLIPGSFIVRKIGVMGHAPDGTCKPDKYYTITKEEYEEFIREATARLEKEFRDKGIE